MEQETERRRRDQGRAILLATGAAVLAAAVGFVAGRETAPDAADATQATCASVADSVESVAAQPAASASPTPFWEEEEAQNQRVSMVANLILQNSTCFGPEVLAQAQTMKDQLAAGADAQALSDAAARAAECANPDRITAFC